MPRERNLDKKSKLRIAVIDRNRCNPQICRTYPCRGFCPVNRAGKVCVSLGADKKPIIDEQLCIGCAICVKKCPTGAISVVNLVQELGAPVHQFGDNTFRLYGLPIPVKEKVTGLLGANGTGKTTALRILSGTIQPNLGLWEKPPAWKEVIEQFRGTELQNYLTALASGKIKAVYKPQQVDKIPLVAKGTVRELIKDERGVFQRVVKELELENILDKKIAELSGGELQRVAIAQALAKKGQFYFFDEPSSFLDVRHRLLVAKAIRALASESEVLGVLVVEHDLAALDFLADVVHICYGKPAVYGIVSKPYAARRGVNVFLDGFIKEENVRFRDYAISFKERGQIFKGRALALQYPELEKKLADFKLRVQEGRLYQGEIVGVFGANALGKTTFAKILAGEISADTAVNTNGDTKKIEPTKIAYKPQYLKPPSSGTVADVLSAATKKFGSKAYRVEVLAPLELESLLERKVEQLSGGELQRVAIALCLSQEVPLYLLDEPSAYLDVEQRVKLAKLLRRFAQLKEKTALVIDHDLLLLNYISDRAIVFSGIPGEEGLAANPTEVKAGMNLFLKSLDITYRQDPETGRPRANKPGSVADREQKEKDEYYGA